MINTIQHNYGLSGQQSPYDDFFGKKARKRREARRKTRQQRREARLDKARLKNEERKADVERTRAETALSKLMATLSSNPESRAANPVTQSLIGSPPPAQASMGSQGILLVVGLLVVGGVVYQVTKNKKAVAAGAAPATAA